MLDLSVIKTHKLTDNNSKTRKQTKKQTNLKNNRNTANIEVMTSTTTKAN